jgi:hypothetical protein
VLGEVVEFGDVVVGFATGGGTAPDAGVPGEVAPLGDVIEPGGVVLGDVVELGEVVLGEFPVGTQGVVVVLLVVPDAGLVELVVVPGEAELLEGVVELEGLVVEPD